MNATPQDRDRRGGRRGRRRHRPQPAARLGQPASARLATPARARVRVTRSSRRVRRPTAPGRYHIDRELDDWTTAGTDPEPGIGVARVTFEQSLRAGSASMASPSTSPARERPVSWRWPRCHRVDHPRPVSLVRHRWATTCSGLERGHTLVQPTQGPGHRASRRRSGSPTSPVAPTSPWPRSRRPSRSTGIRAKLVESTVTDPTSRRATVAPDDGFWLWRQPRRASSRSSRAANRLWQPDVHRRRRRRAPHVLDGRIPAVTTRRGSRGARGDHRLLEIESWRALTGETDVSG